METIVKMGDGRHVRISSQLHDALNPMRAQYHKSKDPNQKAELVALMNGCILADLELGRAEVVETRVVSREEWEGSHHDRNL